MSAQMPYDAFIDNLVREMIIIRVRKHAFPDRLNYSDPFFYSGSPYPDGGDIDDVSLPYGAADALEACIGAYREKVRRMAGEIIAASIMQVPEIALEYMLSEGYDGPEKALEWISDATSLISEEDDRRITDAMGGLIRGAYRAKRDALWDEAILVRQLIISRLQELPAGTDALQPNVRADDFPAGYQT